MSVQSAHRIIAATLLVAGTLGLTSCGVLEGIPKDVDGSLKNATGQVLRVGITEHQPYIVIQGDSENPENTEVTGTEAELLKGYADSIGARVKWTKGNEEQLAEQISKHELDIVAGGFTKKSPWTDKFAMTRPYEPNGKDQEAASADKTELVMGVPLGENALLVSLERYLAEQDGELK